MFLVRRPHRVALFRGGPFTCHLSTSDGGVTWSVTGALPVRLTPYQLTSPDLAFENPSTGYLEVYDRAQHHDVVLFTSNGGAEWHTVTVTGVPTSVSLDGGSLWVVASFCSNQAGPRGLPQPAPHL